MKPSSVVLFFLPANQWSTHLPAARGPVPICLELEVCLAPSKRKTEARVKVVMYLHKGKPRKRSFLEVGS